MLSMLCYKSCSDVRMPGLGRRRRAADLATDDYERVDTRITVFHPDEEGTFIVANGKT